VKHANGTTLPRRSPLGPGRIPCLLRWLRILLLVPHHAAAPIAGFRSAREVLGTIPYAAALVAMLVNGLHSDRRMERRWHAAVPCLLAVIGALGLMTHTQSLKVDVLLFTLVAMCVAFNPPFWAMSKI